MPIGREDGDIVMSDGEKVDISKIRPGDKMPCAYAIGDNHYHLHATKTGIGMACYAAAKPEAPTHD